MNTNAWNRIRYSLFAPFYNQTVRSFEKDRQRSLALLKISPGEGVLLLGCGTGSDLPYIPMGVHISAIDITPAMVLKANTLAQTLGHQAEVKVMDGQALEYPDAEFDAVVLHLILAVIPDPIACLQEAVRVLKPNGRLAIFDKFLPANQQPSLQRRLLNGVTSVAFSDINRQVEPMLATVPLQLLHEETSHVWQALGYRILLLQNIA